ncbi:FKBP-type peptidyl-prolyl cis-trans isomerase [Hugenholtzia roseola]|uniref:FKBP-type peptidyl-prolyl cis-trans isomerase n=1 Tax=Hugenholtzia roseola TaxID=1002 RepID=UPI00040D51AB|nr:FKBP-type peptidyl-prolyl cis-trans isomerase [Hugenholtzia roseola]
MKSPTFSVLLGLFCALLHFVPTSQAQQNPSFPTKGEQNDVRYEIFKNPTAKNEQERHFPTDSTTVKVHLKLYTAQDSLIRNSYQEMGGLPIYLPMGADLPFKFFLRHVNAGDSVVFFMRADSLLKGMAMPPFIEKGSFLRNEMKVVGLLNPSEFQAEMQERQMAMVRQKQAEMATYSAEQRQKLDAFLEEKQMVVEKSPTGLRYKIEKRGLEIPAGDTVVVHYRGKLLDGSVFDASYDRGEPFTFIVGIGQVILGWDEGIRTLGEGGKGTLYIPADMGYGKRSMGSIPADSPLIFDVEILEVRHRKASHDHHGHDHQGHQHD